MFIDEATRGHGEEPSGLGPIRYAPKRLARYRVALELFNHPDTETEYGGPTPEELERAYAGEFDTHPSFAGHLSDATHWCACMGHGR